MNLRCSARALFCAVAASASLTLTLNSSLQAANVSWAVNAGGDWLTPTNWSSNPSLPGAGDNVSISEPADILVTLSASAQSIGSLISDERLTLSGGSLTVATNLIMHNTLTLSGVTLIGATLSTSLGGQISLSSATFDGVTLASQLTLPNNASFFIKNNLTLSSADVSLAASASAGTVMSISGSQSINGTGNISFDGGNGNFDQITSNGPSTLTLSPGVAIKTGAQGGTISTTGLINNGTISAQTASKIITISSQSLSNNSVFESRNGGTLSITSPNWSSTATGQINATGSSFTFSGNWSNAGTINADTSTLTLGGNFTQAALGSFNRSGGQVLLTGTLTGGLALDATTGSWSLSAGTIQSGTISATGGSSLILTSNGGTLDGVSLSANLSIPNGATLNLKNNLFMAGNTISVAAPASSGAVLLINNNQAINGSGTISFDGGAGNFNQINSGSPSTLTLSSGILVKTGTQGGTIQTTGFINNGTISVQTASRSIGIISASFTNNSLVESKTGGILSITGANWTNAATGIINATGSTLTLAGNWSNAGTINVDSSIINLGGNFAQSALGNFNRTGGTVNFTGTLTGGLALNPTTGSWNFLGGTIQSGNVTATGGAALVSTSSGGTLDGVNLGTNLNIPNGATLTTRNGLALDNATITISASGGGGSVLVASGNQAFIGNGVISFEGGPSSFNQINSATPSTLTLAPGILIKSGTQNGAIQTTGLINNGTISAQAANSTITITSATLINSGLLDVKNGAAILIKSNLTTAQLGAFSNTGGLLRVDGTLDNSGANLLLNGSAANLTLAKPITTGSITLNPGSALTFITGAGLVRPAVFSLAGSAGAWQAKLDLTRNNMILTTAPDVASQLKQGANLGAWNGTAGITSSTAQLAASSGTGTALAWSTGTQYTANNGQTAFSGQSFLPTDNLIMYTLAGDGNMDASVTFADFLQLQNHYNQAGSNWQGGDFNYDGSTTFADFLILQNNYNKTLQAGNFQPLSGTSVPEPPTLILPAIAILATLARRSTLKQRQQRPPAMESS